MTDRGEIGHRSQRLRPGAEFDIIRRFQELWGPLAVDIGGDCASVGLGKGARLLTSSDVSVEGVHFRADWLTPREIAYRACAAALSDLAAVGAEPLGLMLALTLPERWRSHLDDLAHGVGDAVRATGAPVLGGDLSMGTDLALAVTVYGESAAPLRRSGASPGELLYVTGRLGGPAAAVSAWNAGRSPELAHRHSFVAPRPRLREARWLRRRGVTASTDISDGLAADARNIASASGVEIWLDVDSVPCMMGVAPLDAIAGGEEYELLVVAPSDLDQVSFEHRFGIPLTVVGRVVDWHEEGIVRARVDLPGGYDHYSR